MDLSKYTIREAHEALKKKEISSVELTKDCLECIKKQNDNLNAYITVSEEEALKQASMADEKIAQGEIAFLTGIPYGVKDAILVEGMRSTGGSKILDNYVAPYSSTCIDRIQNVGGVILGKQNCDAFGHGASNENSDYGPVKNPFDNDLVSGGSSGGSAVSVAANMSLYSIAEDTGGSIRQPASFNGIVGLKVSYGRNSRYGIMPMASSLDTLGPMGRSAWDVAAILEVTAGKDQYDSTTVPDEVPKYTEMLDEDISGMTFGLPKEYFDHEMDEEIRANVMEAVKKLESLGAKIKEVSLPHTQYAIPVYYIIVPSEDSSNLARLDAIRYGVRSEEKDSLLDLYTKSRAKGFGDEVKRRIMIGTYALSAGYYDAFYKKASQVRTLIRQDFENVFKDVDALITPTSPMLPFKIGEKVDDPLLMYAADVFVCPASLAGVPAVSVPCGSSKSGLPIGLQIIGPRLHEARILNIAHQYETK